jgi:hypothetical protein
MKRDLGLEANRVDSPTEQYQSTVLTQNAERKLALECGPVHAIDGARFYGSCNSTQSRPK